jgi:lipopolysaccharide biosynthesis glycosyltransferase
MSYKEILLDEIEEIIEFDFLTDEAQCKSFHIGFGIDDNFVRYMGVEMISICEHNKEASLVFHVLSNRLSSKNIEYLQMISKEYKVKLFVYLLAESAFSDLPTLEQYPVSIYYRLILGSIVKAPRILYCDADIICMDKIDALFELDMENKILAAVPDMEPIASKRTAKLGLLNHTYFNSGVLLIDIAAWEKNRVLDKIIKALQENKKRFNYPDQDALNFVLQGQVLYLARKYNYINTPGLQNAAEIVFLHFAAQPKPWGIAWHMSKLCSEFTKDIYAFYEQKSPWKDCGLVFPNNYRDMHKYANSLFANQNYAMSAVWYLKYVMTKMKKRWYKR